MLIRCRIGINRKISMAYNDFAIVAGGLIHVPILIGVAKLIDTKTANSKYVQQQAAQELAEAQARAQAEAKAKATAEAQAQAEAKAKAVAKEKAKSVLEKSNKSESKES